MSSEEKRRTVVSEIDSIDLDLPFSLYLSFANVAGISIKLCGVDGQPLPGAPAAPPVGPCAVLGKGNAFSETCARNHAAAAAMAFDLRRPYVTNCHLRLAAWAVPILQNDEPLPAAVICGGMLFIEPDTALAKHAERVAIDHNVDPAELVHSLDSVPVLPREQARAIADFLFRMSAAFVSYASLPGASAVDPPPAAPQASVVFPPARKEETAKAKLQRARMLGRQNIEAEIVRLLQDRRPEAASDILAELLGGESESAPVEGVATNLYVAETVARLFRTLIRSGQVPQSVYEKLSRLIAEVLSQKASGRSADAVARASRKFVLIAEELTGEPRPRKVRAIQKFLENNLAKKLTLGTVGKKFGLGEKSLDALMRKHCGMGLTDYVISLRVSEAKRLLRAADLSIGQIARKTGFRDQSYFTKVFKSQVGSTPTEFRKKKGTTKGPKR